MITFLRQIPGRHPLRALQRVETRRARIAVFLLFALVVLLRQPALLLKPRFFCEEGMIYYAYALHHPMLDALLRTAAGYYSLVQNVSAILAADCVPVEWAPLVTTGVGAAIQLLPYAIILWSHASFWQRDYAKFLGCLAVLTTAVSDEIWLTTLGVHFHLSLVTSLLLLEEGTSGRGWRGTAHVWLLLMAGLTSPVSGFLTPLYFLKAWWEGNRASLVQALALAGATVVQLIVVIGNAGLLQERARAELDFPAFAAIWFNKSFVLPIAGTRIASWVAFAGLEPLRTSGPRLFWACGLALAAVLALFLAVVCNRQHPRRMAYIVGGYALLLTMSIITSTMPEGKFPLVEPHWATRYFYVPNVLLVLALLNGCYGGVSRPQWQRLLCAGCFCLAVGTGTWGLKALHSYNPEWPNWKEECAKWRQDPTCEPKTWPPCFTVDLAGTRRRGE